MNTNDLHDLKSIVNICNIEFLIQQSDISHKTDCCEMKGNSWFGCGVNEE